MVLGNKCDVNDKRQVSKERGEKVRRLVYWITKDWENTLSTLLCVHFCSRCSIEFDKRVFCKLREYCYLKWLLEKTNVFFGRFNLNKTKGTPKSTGSYHGKCTIGSNVVGIVDAKHLMFNLSDGLQLTTVFFAPSWLWSTESNSWRPAQRQTSTWKT